MKYLIFNSLEVHVVKFDAKNFFIKPPNHVKTIIDFSNTFLLVTGQTELIIYEHLGYYNHMNVLSKILNKQYVK